MIKLSILWGYRRGVRTLENTADPCGAGHRPAAAYQAALVGQRGSRPVGGCGPMARPTWPVFISIVAQSLGRRTLMRHNRILGFGRSLRELMRRRIVGGEYRPPDNRGNAQRHNRHDE